MLCSVEDCGTKKYCRGYCQKHYVRLMRHGDPLHYPYHESVVDKVARMSERHGECLLWAGAVNKDGYAVIGKSGSGANVHRELWIEVHGPLDKGIEVDHTCLTRHCVALGHLRAVTRSQNMQNLSGKRSNNRSGVRGVWWSTRAGKWTGAVGHDGKTHGIGLHTNLSDAAEAVRLKRIEIFTHNDSDRR